MRVSVKRASTVQKTQVFVSDILLNLEHRCMLLTLPDQTAAS